LLGKEYVVDAHLAQALLNTSFEEVILETPGLVDLVPSDLRVGKQASVIEDQKMWRFRLKNTLETVKEEYDYVIIDCPPNLATYTIMALVAADYYIMPTDPEEFAVDGMEGLTELADGIVASLNPRLELLGIVVTRYHKNLRNAGHDEQMDRITEKYGEKLMLPSIRRDKTVGQAIKAATTIFHVNHESNVAQDYMALAEAVLARS
jgi:chromosome partitioning protein